MTEHKNRPWWKPGSGPSQTPPDDSPDDPTTRHEDQSVVLVPFTYGGITTVRAHYPNRSRRDR